MLITALSFVRQCQQLDIRCHAFTDRNGRWYVEPHSYFVGIADLAQHLAMLLSEANDMLLKFCRFVRICFRQLPFDRSAPAKCESFVLHQLANLGDGALEVLPQQACFMGELGRLAAPSSAVTSKDLSRWPGQNLPPCQVLGAPLGDRERMPSMALHADNSPFTVLLRSHLSISFNKLNYS